MAAKCGILGLVAAEEDVALASKLLDRYLSPHKAMHALTTSLGKLPEWSKIQMVLEGSFRNPCDFIGFKLESWFLKGFAARTYWACLQVEGDQLWTVSSNVLQSLVF